MSSRIDAATIRTARQRGNATLVATVNADRVAIDRPWAAELAEFEHANRERDMRNLGFGRRESLCG